MEFGKEIRNLWYLDDNVIFLNHGSFGATPKSILQDSLDWQIRAEQQPVSFFIDEYFSLIREAAIKLADFVGCKGEQLVFVDNATTGVNTAIHAILPSLKPGDEILTTNHVYPAVRNAIDYICKISGTKSIEAQIPFPLKSKNEILDSIALKINQRTKFAVFDHITSPTAIIYPVKEISELCHQYNIPVVIDGAHAPGMLDLNIEDIGCDWYTGNCHKWLYTPKGCALLWTAEKFKELTEPLSISLFYGQGYTNEFDWTGTKNPASYLSIFKSLEFYSSYKKENIIKYMHELSIKSRDYLCSELDLEKPVPDELLGAIVTLPFPGNFPGTHEESVRLRKLLLDKYGIELFVTEFEGKIWFRISAQIYNYFEEYQILAKALKEICNGNK